jgi:hypothetical protein
MSFEEAGERDERGKLPELFGLLDLRCGYWQFPVAKKASSILIVDILGQCYEHGMVPMGFVDSGFHV